MCDHQGNQKLVKSKIFCLFKAYETSTNQISRSYHEGIPSYKVKKSQNLLLDQNLSMSQTFLETQFFSLYRYILLKLQQQMLICVCKFGCNQDCGVRGEMSDSDSRLSQISDSEFSKFL